MTHSRIHAFCYDDRCPPQKPRSICQDLACFTERTETFGDSLSLRASFLRDKIQNLNEVMIGTCKSLFILYALRRKLPKPPPQLDLTNHQTPTDFVALHPALRLGTIYEYLPTYSGRFFSFHFITYNRSFPILVYQP